MKAFWNDTDGLSLLEFIALWVMVLWGVCMIMVAGMALFLLLKGQAMDKFWIDYIDVLADVPVTVAIGLYGKGAAGEFGQALAGLRQSRENMSRKGESQDEDTGNKYPV